MEEYKHTCEELKRQQAKMNEVMELHASDLDIKEQLYNAQEQKLQLQTEALEAFQ